MTNKGFVFSHFDNTYTCSASTSSYMLTWKQHRKLSVDALDFSRNFPLFPSSLGGTLWILSQPVRTLRGSCVSALAYPGAFPFVPCTLGCPAGAVGEPGAAERGARGAVPAGALQRGCARRLLSGWCAGAGADVPSRAALCAKLKMLTGDFYVFEQLTLLT